VAAKIVENDDVARRQCRNQAALHPEREGVAIDRAIEDEGRDDPVASQPGEEGERFPMPMRNPGEQGLASGRPAPRAGHVGFHPGLIDKDEPRGIKLVLMRFPAFPEPRHLRAQLLACYQRFF